MQKLITSAAIAAALALPASAFAGAKSNLEVIINTQYSYAWGAMSSVYNSADSTQRIECWITSYKTSTGGPHGGCYAYSASGQSANCYFFNNPTLAQAVASMSSDSTTYFTWNSDGSCNVIESHASSMYGPKR